MRGQANPMAQLLKPSDESSLAMQFTQETDMMACLNLPFQGGHKK
jgi:hypothetical protein